MDGILIINKEKGMTSRDVVNIVCKLLNTKKIGHTGTLDPLATGVLVLTIGKATKIGELLTSYSKEYIAEVKMGLLTDTLDMEGKVLKEEIPPDIDISSLVKSFQKTYLQEVPIYSAVKVNGKKLYEYARNGEEVILPKKEVNIKEIELLDEAHDTFRFRCLVSKGTYIRSLIRDMGNAVNNFFTMTELNRTKQGQFNIEDSYTIEDVENGNFKILKIEDVLDYPKIVMNDELLKKVSNGMKIHNDFNIESKVLFMNSNNELVAIYEKYNNLLKIWKMIKID